MMYDMRYSCVVFTACRMYTGVVYVYIHASDHWCFCLNSIHHLSSVHVAHGPWPMHMHTHMYTYASAHADSPTFCIGVHDLYIIMYMQYACLDSLTYMFIHVHIRIRLGTIRFCV